MVRITKECYGENNEIIKLKRAIERLKLELAENEQKEKLKKNCDHKWEYSHRCYIRGEMDSSWQIYFDCICCICETSGPNLCLNETVLRNPIVTEEIYRVIKKHKKLIDDNYKKEQQVMMDQWEE